MILLLLPFFIVVCCFDDKIYEKKEKEVEVPNWQCISYGEKKILSRLIFRQFFATFKCRQKEKWWELKKKWEFRAHDKVCVYFSIFQITVLRLSLNPKTFAPSFRVYLFLGPLHSLSFVHFILADFRLFLMHIFIWLRTRW